MPLPRAVPAGVRHTMQGAFEDLEKTITPQDSKDFETATLESVQSEVLSIEDRLAARGSLRNMRRLMPLFTALEHYSKVIDVLCNGTPFMPWLWAPITLILRISCEYVEAFEQIIRAYSRIATSLQRFQILGDVFSGNARFQQTLAVFYEDILQFHKHAYKFVRRNGERLFHILPCHLESFSSPLRSYYVGWKLLFLTSWGRFQRRFDNVTEDMKRHEKLIDKEAVALDISDSRDLRQELRAWKEESLDKISTLDEEQSLRDFHSILSWLRINESDQEAIFESVSSQGNKYPGTCSWTIQNAKFQAWLQRRPETPMLWLVGSAGSGKSVISTQLVNFMKNAGMTVLHHFCTFSSSASSAYDQILKTLLQQLLRQDAELTAHVYGEYVLKKRTATAQSLEQVLQMLLTSSSDDPNKSSYIWIVLDGVDELREESPNIQARLLSLMKQISSTTSARGAVVCKILISSRPSQTLLQALRKKPLVSLTEEKECLTKSIEEYASQRLREVNRKFEQLGIGSEQIEGIVRQISAKADGKSTPQFVEHPPQKSFTWVTNRAYLARHVSLRSTRIGLSSFRYFCERERVERVHTSAA